jgi:hypothetical protein
MVNDDSNGSGCGASLFSSFCQVFINLVYEYNMFVACKVVRYVTNAEITGSM